MNILKSEQELDLNKVIGDNIKSYRGLMGFTQKSLAKFLGVSTPMISYYEKGNRELGMPNMIKLSDLFNIHFSELMEDNKGIVTSNE